jgi:NTE family protein
MQKSIISEKLRRIQPDVYITPEIIDVDILEFYKAEQIYEQAKPARQKLMQALEQIRRAG